MKTRRHHNNKGETQIQRGKTTEQLKMICKRLGLKYGKQEAEIKAKESGENIARVEKGE